MTCHPLETCCETFSFFLDLSNLEFTTESVLLGLIILGVLAFDIMFGAVLGNLLFGVRRRDGRPTNAFARRAEDVYNRSDTGRVCSVLTRLALRLHMTLSD